MLKTIKNELSEAESAFLCAVYKINKVVVVYKVVRAHFNIFNFRLDISNKRKRKKKFFRQVPPSRFLAL